MPFPLSVEVIVFWVCDYPSCIEVIVEEFEFVGISLSVEVIVRVLILCLSL